MARDTMTYESYEPDSFDNPPKGPVGVHRGARSVMARLCPFIVVILVAALCGVGAWAWISGEYKNVVGGSSQTATTSKSDSSSKAETKNSTKDDSSSTSTATVNKATQVRVVNATGIQGYAGQQADVLQTAGYTSVEATNPSGTLPASSVVWYQNETDKATAEDVATTLGISAVEQVQGLAVPITVVLLN